MKLIKTSDGYALNVKHKNKTYTYLFNADGEQIGTKPIMVSSEREFESPLKRI